MESRVRHEKILSFTAICKFLRVLFAPVGQKYVVTERKMRPAGKVAEMLTEDGVNQDGGKYLRYKRYC